MPEARPDGVPARTGLKGARVAFGVCGGIAAYKAADIVSALVQGGAVVDVMLSHGATRFIQPLTFQALTHRPVYTGVFEGWDAGETGHVSIAREADVVLVAPATANAIAHLANGMVENMIGAVALATEAPLVIAPAMEHHMWHHPATRRNVETLRQDGATIVEPERGYLASGAQGDGRLGSRASIMFAVRSVLGRAGQLSGRRVVVSAGGTREALDPVRYIGNRSSGTMGLALALAALDAGANVTLVATPAVDRDSWGGPVVEVESATAMQEAVAVAVREADVLIMAAAVSDFRPQTPSASKIKKQAGEDTISLELVKNPDIVKVIEKPGMV
ncbi:MAG TPA: bifunctional phosphopantothenoylcysteine decarboxylase/phosphopantothenate--cysteine ligase CoaBC, partial [Thermomicrobiales bacterium]|nr:bifunctional phosphopantothenoylcysteine decarboxylase/phosphopantothenate--cysteine ligase CoaBC [Thermomicrobiales bacterium]